MIKPDQRLLIDYPDLNNNKHRILAINQMLSSKNLPIWNVTQGYLVQYYTSNHRHYDIFTIFFTSFTRSLDHKPQHEFPEKGYRYNVSGVNHSTGFNGYAVLIQCNLRFFSPGKRLVDFRSILIHSKSGQIKPFCSNGIIWRHYVI